MFLGHEVSLGNLKTQVESPPICYAGGAMRSYRPYCALARGLDVIGDRWVLLIVRELVGGPRRYGQLVYGLPGIATNLLALGRSMRRRRRPAG